MEKVLSIIKSNASNVGETCKNSTALSVECSNSANVTVNESQKLTSDSESKICCRCNKVLASKWSLTRHMQIVHNTPVIKGKKKLRCIVDGCDWSGTSRQGLVAHKMKCHSIEPSQKPVKCPECFERFQTVKNLAQHAYDLHKKEEQDFELRTRNFQNRAEFDEFVRMEISGGMTTISVKDKCTYMRCALAGKVRHRADHLSKKALSGTKKVVSHCPCFMNVRAEDDGSINVEYVLGHLGHDEKMPIERRFTSMEIEAVILLLKEKRTPDWISRYFQEHMSENDRLNTISSSEIRSIMCSHLSDKEQNEIYILEREVENFNCSKSVRSCVEFSGTSNQMENLSAVNYPSDEYYAMNALMDENLVRMEQPAEFVDASIVEDTRLKLLELLDMIFQLDMGSMGEVNRKISEALSFVKYRVMN